MEYDLIVAGGGISGCAAAISAARCGLDVLLIERYGFLGGTLTANGTGPMMTFHAGDRQVVRGITGELIDRLQAKGSSPVELTDIKFGTELNIEVEAEGYETQNTVFIASKDAEPEIPITLAQATKQVAKAQPAKRAESDKAKTQKKASDQAVSGNGTVSVKAKPWAIVSIDGARVGNTPINKRTLKAGSHKVELNHPAKQKKVNKTITLKNKQHIELQYDFNADKWL